MVSKLSQRYHTPVRILGVPNGAALTARETQTLPRAAAFPARAGNHQAVRERAYVCARVHAGTHACAHAEAHTPVITVLSARAAPLVTRATGQPQGAALGLANQRADGRVTADGGGSLRGPGSCPRSLTHSHLLRCLAEAELPLGASLPLSHVDPRHAPRPLREDRSRGPSTLLKGA